MFTVYRQNTPSLGGECSSPPTDFFRVFRWPDGSEHTEIHVTVEQFPDIPLNDPALAAMPEVVARFASLVGGLSVTPDGDKIVFFLRSSGPLHEQWILGANGATRHIIRDVPYSTWERELDLPKLSCAVSTRLFSAVWAAAATTHGVRVLEPTTVMKSSP